MCAEASPDILPEPPHKLKRVSDELTSLIRKEIARNGPLPFSDYMEMALYEPGLGYYSAGLHKLGKSGDFVTAPELGTLFAACMAMQVEETGKQLGTYRVLEVGAGTGRLAVDLLNELDPDLAPEQYVILERSADLRQVQAERISAEAPEWKERVTWLDGPPKESWKGLLIANEVIDALAVERFQVTGGQVEQLCVTEAETGLDRVPAPATVTGPQVGVGQQGGHGVREGADPARFDQQSAALAGLENAVRHLEADTGTRFEDGYRSEIQINLASWLESLTCNLEQGLALFIDYGYPRSEFYLPERSDGTLMCHYRHQAHDNPFFWPGLQDITAWVDFTALAEAADHCRLDVEGYTNQSMFLVACGLEQALRDKVRESNDGGVALNAEARQLTMPGMMGERFQVMGLGRGLDREPRGFSLRDLRYRL